MLRKNYKKICDYLAGHPSIMVAGFFLVNFIVRGVLSDFCKAIRVYNDELYYYGLARSLYNGWGITVRGIEVDFQKILYSLILAPTFAIESSVVQMRVIAWINSFLISLSVFPAYGIAKKLFHEKKYILISMVYWITMPTMVSPVYIMCESLFLPLALTFVYMVVVALEAESGEEAVGNKKNHTARQMILHAGMGVVLYLMFQIKTSSLYFLVAYFLVTVVHMLYHNMQKKDKLWCVARVAVMTMVFLALYYAVKIGLYQGGENAYIANAVTTIGIADRLQSMLIYFPYNLVYMILAFGVIPVLMPLGIWKKLSVKEKEMQLFLYGCILVACAAITYLISSKEAAGMSTVREHIRYVEPLIYVSWCAFAEIFIRHRDAYDAKAWKSVTLVHTIYFAVFVMIASNFNGQTLVDHSYLKVYQLIVESLAEWTQNFGQGTLIPLLFRLLLSLGFAGILYLFYRKNRHIWKIFLVGSVCLNLCNYAVAYVQAHNTYQADRAVVERFDRTDDELSQLSGNILVIANIKELPVQPYLDTCLDTPVFIVTLRDLYDCGIIEDGVIELGTERIPAMRPERSYYRNLNQVDYILTWGDISMEQVSKVEGLPIEEDGYILYENLTPEEVHVSCTYEEVMTEKEKQQMMVFVAD